jgi:hypothetical protein
MAGWDLPFDVAGEDEALARDCFRILRRTCARHYINFRYYAERGGHRTRFILVFDGRPHQLGLASADLALEMFAVSMLQRHPRQKRLPLRLLTDVTYSGSEDPIRLQPQSDRVPPNKAGRIAGFLEEYALAWGAWSRGHLPPADFLDAQHSLLTNLAVNLADGVTTRTGYDELIRRLRVPEYWEQECLDLGKHRNRVKHRNKRHEAERYAEQHVQCVYSVAYAVTGIDAMPRTVYMLRWEQDPTSAFRSSPVYDRYGRPRRFTRY